MDREQIAKEDIPRWFADVWSNAYDWKAKTYDIHYIYRHILEREKKIRKAK